MDFWFYLFLHSIGLLSLVDFGKSEEQLTFGKQPLACLFFVASAIGMASEVADLLITMA